MATTTKSDEVMAAEAQDTVKRVTELERIVAELRATTAPVEKMGQIQIDLGKISSKTEVASEEIKNLRSKQESDMQKSLDAAKSAADSNKPDYKIMIGAFSIIIGLMGALTSYVTSGDAKIEKTLLSEINEAKSSASAAGGKAKPVAAALEKFKETTNAKIEELQQRVPSISEWETAMQEIDTIQDFDIGLTQRVTVQEGKNDRALLLIEKLEEATALQIDDITQDMISDDEKIIAMTGDIASVRSALNGAITELEAQGRGMNAVMNAYIANSRQIDAILWQKIVPGESLPENDLYSTEIPARAVVNLGE